ncbi:MAG: AAA family ATPase, partial [Anaerolineales bacterium]
MVNQKGGVGKTTTAINLGAYLSHFKQRVLIVDIDPQANATSCLGVDKYSV